MPDLAQTRPDLQAELESAASEVYFGASEPVDEPAPPPEPDVGPAPMLVTDTAEIPEPVPLWRDRRAWISGFASFSVHLAVMVVLALMMIVLHNEHVIDAVNATLGDEEIAALDVNLNAAEMPKFELDASPSFNVVPVEMERLTPEELDRRFAAEQFAPGIATENAADGNGLLFARPANGRAVTKGSFAVWTEPNDPKPHEAYQIIVEVDVPDGVKKFPASDLHIEVVGTDNYYLQIPGPGTPPWLKGDLPIVDGKVQVPIRVPGAEANVRDTINVRSVRILKERQRMRITF